MLEVRPGTSAGAFVVFEGFAVDSLLDKADPTWEKGADYNRPWLAQQHKRRYG